MPVGANLRRTAKGRQRVFSLPTIADTRERQHPDVNSLDKYRTDRRPALELHRALHAGRDVSLGVGQIEASSEGPTGGIDDPIDHGYRGVVLAQQGCLGRDLRGRADLHLAEQPDRQHHVDAQRIHLCQLQDRASALAGLSDLTHVLQAIGHHAVDRAADAALLECLLQPPLLQLGEPAVNFS